MHTRTPINLALIKLVPTSIEDYPILQNMGRFYVYDMSEYFADNAEWNMPEDGLYECIDFKKYWEAEDAWCFLIRYDNQLAGFAIIDKKGSDSSTNFNMAQFFILQKFTHKGVGKYVAQLCFKKFKGLWEVMVMPENVGAYHFWKKAIDSFTGGHYEEYFRKVAHLNNAEKNIFKFESK